MKLEDATVKEEWKITSINVPVKLHKKLKEIAIREDKDLGDIFKELMEQYVKTHGEGNPVYSLDKFQDPDFRIAPALFSKYEKIRVYYETIKSKQEYQELDRILNVWVKIHNEFYGHYTL